MYYKVWKQAKDTLEDAAAAFKTGDFSAKDSDGMPSTAVNQVSELKKDIQRQANELDDHKRLFATRELNYSREISTLN